MRCMFFADIQNMIRYDRRKLEFGIWNLIKGPGTYYRHTTLSNVPLVL